MATPAGAADAAAPAAANGAAGAPTDPGATPAEPKKAWYKLNAKTLLTIRNFFVCSIGFDT